LFCCHNIYHYLLPWKPERGKYLPAKIPKNVQIFRSLFYRILIVTLKFDYIYFDFFTNSIWLTSMFFPVVLCNLIYIVLCQAHWMPNECPKNLRPQNRFDRHFKYAFNSIQQNQLRAHAVEIRNQIQIHLRFWHSFTYCQPDWKWKCRHSAPENWGILGDTIQSKW